MGNIHHPVYFFGEESCTGLQYDKKGGSCQIYLTDRHEFSCKLCLSLRVSLLIIHSVIVRFGKIIEPIREFLISESSFDLHIWEGSCTIGKKIFLRFFYSLI